MEFSDFMVIFKKHANEVFKNNQHLFLVDLSKDELWEKYLESFPAEKNKIYRVRKEMDCSCCKSFIRHFGNVVGIQDNKIVSFWDFHTDDDTYEPVLRAMEELVKSSLIANVFVTKDSQFGTEKSLEYLEDKTVHTWNHFHINIPNGMIHKQSSSVNEKMGEYRDVRNVFKRSLEEISKDSVQEVLDLISEQMLYRADEWKSNLEKFALLQKEYKKLKTVKEKENYCWIKSMEVGPAIGKIRNHSIGTLLIDLTNEVDTDEAVKRYESIMAPTNYKRPRAIFTKKMVEDAQKTIEKLGLKDSLGRRHSKISDITINNVLWANRNAKKAMKNADSVFEELKEEVAVNPKQFENIQGINIDTFLEKLPNVKSLDILLESRNEGNLMSLVSPVNKDAPSLFKWDNGFSWSYKGNLADSMKERVKSAGGKIDGVLRFSIQWNTEYDNRNDYDAHCIEPGGNEIYFPSAGSKHRSTGVLDVDIRYPDNSQVAVENITWSDERKMQEGTYRFYVNNYSHRGGKSGFDAEIEFNGQLYEFSYPKDLKQSEKLLVAEVIYKNGEFSIGKSLPSSSSVNSRTIWNVKTNQFIPVSVFMFSPNYWNDQQGIGNKHYFFMLANCLNDTQPNGFYNEYLKEDLMKHKKVFEALGSKMKVEDSDSQLSGVGFSSTQRNYVIARIDNRVTKIIF